MGDSKKALKILLQACVAVCALFGWLFGVLTGGILGAIGALVCGGGVCLAIILSAQAKNKQLRFDLQDPLLYKICSEDDIVKTMIRSELDRMERSGGKFVAKRTLAGRLILTAAVALINGVMLHFCYHHVAAFLWGTLLALVYTVVFLRMHSINMLLRAVKKDGDSSISEVVRKETLDMQEQPRCKMAAAVMAVLAVVSVGSVFVLNGTERWSFQPYGAFGMKLTQYKPAAFNWGYFAEQTLQIPETAEGRPVVEIGEKALKNNDQIQSVILPDTVTYIGKYAFEGCDNLEQVILSKNLETIDSGAFRDSGITEIRLPDSLQVLNGEAFQSCSKLVSVVIPEGVTSIRGDTFAGCTELKSVTLHDGIEQIHAYAFQGCSSLEQIDLPPKITEIRTYTFDGCSALKSIEIPSGVTRIAAHAFSGCSSLSEVFIPDTVKEIGSSAFRECSSLREIQVPHDVRISERAFKDSPTKVEQKAFSDQDWEKIEKEAREKGDVETLYYIYQEDDPDTIYKTDVATVTIADDSRISGLLSPGLKLQNMDDEKAVLEYLKKAKQDGVTKIEYAIYSQTATDIAGTDWFVGGIWQIDEMIAEAERMIAEAEDAA